MLGKQGRCADNLCRLFDVGVITCRCHAGAMLVQFCRSPAAIRFYSPATVTLLVQSGLGDGLKSEYGDHCMRQRAQSATPVAQPYARARNCTLNRQTLSPSCGHRRLVRLVQKNARQRRSKRWSSTGTIRPPILPTSLPSSCTSIRSTASPNLSRGVGKHSRKASLRACA